MNKRLIYSQVLRLALSIAAMLFLIVGYSLQSSMSAQKRTDSNQLIGTFKVTWKYTITGKDMRKYDDISKSDPKAWGTKREHIEWTDEQTIVHTGELSGDLPVAPFPGDKTVYRDYKWHNSISGGVSWIEMKEGLYICDKTHKVGKNFSETEKTTTYTIQDIDKKEWGHIRPWFNYNFSEYPKNIKYDFQINNVDESWRIREDGTETRSFTDSCGKKETKQETIAKDNQTRTNVAAGLAQFKLEQDPNFHKQLQGIFENPPGRSFSVTRSLTADYQETKEFGYSYIGKATLEFTLTYEDHPSNLEVVINTPADYGTWLPEGGANEKTKGNDMLVGAELRVKGNSELSPLVKAKFTFELVDTSQERGVCLNVPDGGVVDTTNPLDLRFENNSQFTISDKDQKAVSKKSELGAQIRINSFDWGARARLKVTAVTDDNHTLIGHLDIDESKSELIIPKDENNNQIADVWEKANNIFEKNLPADWNDINTPSGHSKAGDGISLFERYRGFEFLNAQDADNSGRHHERLSPACKYLFIYDPDGIVRRSILSAQTYQSSISEVSEMRVRFVSDKQWSGPGAYGDLRRIVNFNYATAHLVDQHVLDVRNSNRLSSFDPQGYLGGAVNSPDRIILGIAWIDYSSPKPHNSPGKCYRIEIFINNIKQVIDDNLFYHTSGMEKFGHKKLAEMTKAEKDEVRREANKYRDEHKTDWQEAIDKNRACAISHEIGHGIGIEHHIPDEEGSRDCLMRYFEQLLRMRPNDRFELNAREPWPNRYCTQSENTTGNKDCRAQIKVTDK